jgi:hypothetical protein
MKPEILDSRDAELRSALVKLVSRSAHSRRRSRKLVITSIIIFAIAGAMTGGAVAAATINAPPQHAVNDALSEAAHEQVIDQNAILVDAPIVRSGSGTTIIRLGKKPAGATNLVVAFECTDVGTLTTLIDGHNDGQKCGESDQFNPTASQEPVFGTGSHTFKIVAAPGIRFTVWISWIAAASFGPSSAQLAELADGKVTRAEYLAAYDRFAACMADAGYPLGDVPRNTTLLDYATPGDIYADAAFQRCYTTEFDQVDTVWQLENWSTSYTAVTERTCLRGIGVTPAMTEQALYDQIEKYDLDKCLLGQ